MGCIVYFSLPAHGHINPTLPVFREMVRRHQPVVYYSSELFRRAIKDTGAQFRGYGEPFRMPEQGPGPFAQVSTTVETLLELSCAVLEHHLGQVKALRPTHIVYDSFAPWGRLVAQLLRLPTIALIPSILVSAEIDSRYGAKPESQTADPRLTPQWYAEFQSRCRACLRPYDLPELPAPPQLLQTYGDLNLVFTSRFFQPAAETFEEQRFEFVGPCFDFRPEAPAFPFEKLDGRPLVFISLGTVYGDQPRFYRMCLEELAATPWQVVLATGGHLPENLGRLPENFIVRSFVPQIEILQRSAAFVTHGGMNSVQEALYHGVPMVVLPLAADQFYVSARASELGAALVLDMHRIEAGAIRGSIAKILSGGSYAEAAVRAGESLRTAGGYRKAADEIERFCSRRG